MVDADELEEREFLGLLYFEEKLFTGVAVEKHPNGQKSGEFTYKDGKPHGLVTEWYETGQKKGEATYKDDKLWIATKYWDRDGTPD